VSDIADKLPKETQTVAAIMAYHKKRGDSEPQRGYLGASIIGHSCERYLWYTFRQCCKEYISGRAYRLFETGDLAEPRFVKELREIGCTVHDTDENGDQWEVMEHGGHFSGHMDGAALGIPEAPKTWHVLEFKTHNNKSFAALKKNGVAKSKPMHYAQMMAYMHLTGMKRALYLAVDKSTDELYSERVKYDKAEAERLMQRAFNTIVRTDAPERISKRSDYYECNWCSARDICWGDPLSVLPVSSVSCRQCCYATPVMNGVAAWECTKHERGLSVSDQDKACKHHIALPDMFSSSCRAEFIVEDSGDEYVEHTLDDGSTFRNGTGSGAFSTAELAKIPHSALGNTMVETAKEKFGATVGDCSDDDVMARYPKEDCRIVWEGSVSCLPDAWRKEYGKDIASSTMEKRHRNFEYNAGEFTRGRLAIHWTETNKAEIRESKE
jgi:hypothetical protein